MRNKPRVSDETRQRVLNGMQELGYVYNRGAASLRSESSGTVGVAINDIADPFFAQLLIAIQSTLHEKGRMVFLCHATESPRIQDDFIDALREYNADGLIISPAVGTEPASLRRLVDWHMPCVLVTRSLPGSDFSFVGTNDQRGAELATEHLIGLGHRRIGLIGGGAAISTGRERLAGYLAMHDKHALPVDRALIVPCPTNRRGGIAAIGQLLALAEPPTAAICFADIIAFGAMLELSRRGLRPGPDFSIVGYDDVIEASLWNPPLTTVSVQRHAMGVAAAQLLTELIETQSLAPRRVIFEPSLTVRGSSGPPPMRAESEAVK
jgi:LacI family transcriptional regulator